MKELRTELGPCLPQEHCGAQTLATVARHADIVAACAPLYAAIEELAHASEACSPTSDLGSDLDEETSHALSIGNAVRLEVAPLVANGQLGAAGRRVLDAMRFADDIGRKSTILGSAVSSSLAVRLVDTLDEIAIDPRLTADDAHAIARDLDVLVGSPPRWDAIMRQEQVSIAMFAVVRDSELVAVLATLDAQRPVLRQACSGALRDCVEHMDEVSEGGADFTEYARRLGQRDSALAFVRMQVELRLAPAEDCATPSKLRAIVKPWADRVIVGDEREPVVTPLTWQHVSVALPKRAPRVLRCVPAAT